MDGVVGGVGVVFRGWVWVGCGFGGGGGNDKERRWNVRWGEWRRERRREWRRGEMEKGEVGEVGGETEWRNGREVCIVKVVVFVVDVVAAGGRCDTCSDLRFFFVSAKLSRSIFIRWANFHPARANWLRATTGSRLRGPSTAPRCGISGDTTRVAVLSRAVEVVAEKWGRMGGEGALASALMFNVL